MRSSLCSARSRRAPRAARGRAPRGRRAGRGRRGAAVRPCARCGGVSRGLSTGDRGCPVTRVGWRGVAAGRRRGGGVVAVWWRHGGGASGCRGVQGCTRGAKALLLLHTAHQHSGGGAPRGRGQIVYFTVDGAAWVWWARVAGPLEERFSVVVRNRCLAFTLGLRSAVQ